MSKTKDANAIAWQPIYWADVLEQRELKYFRDAKRNGDLDYTKLRKFVITALGDAVGSVEVKSTHQSTYHQIGKRITDAFKELYEVGLEQNSAPLIVMAHSLGGQIVSNYIWDMQRGHTQAPTDFERMKTLAGMVTFGCNIPLFTFAYKQVKPITFPATGLKKAVRDKARWLNFYDPDDILGWPLKPINAAYKKVVDRDIAINVGALFSSWNPASHNGYWTDNDFTKPVSRLIASFL